MPSLSRWPWGACFVCAPVQPHVCIYWCASSRPSGSSREDIETLHSYVLPKMVVTLGANDLRQPWFCEAPAGGPDERHS
jgi:hypothetical protein